LAFCLKEIKGFYGKKSGIGLGFWEIFSQARKKVYAQPGAGKLFFKDSVK